MSPAQEIPRSQGRQLFGLDPAGYHAARPSYPEAVFATLRDRCDLRSASSVLEIGPGTGLATRQLADEAAGSVVALEPDPALAGYLADQMAAEHLAVDVRIATLEEAELEAETFDLATSATAFHWVDQARGLAKVARVLRPGRWWAMFWNVFGDPGRHDAFHEATAELLTPLEASPSGKPEELPFALDRDQRMTDLRELGGFVDVDSQLMRWTLVLTRDATRRLYATYSSINRLSPNDRRLVLDEVARIAHDDFGGRVERNMVTAMYVGRRPPVR